MSDDDIPILRDVVARKPPQGPTLEQVDKLFDSVSAAAAALIEKLVAEALHEMEESLRIEITTRLNAELPELIQKALHEKPINEEQ